MAKVSVIIPAYNASRYICRAIDSVLQQTYPNIEIIIVNDASTDATEEVVSRQYGHLLDAGKLKYYSNPHNLSRAATANKGAQTASGDFLFFLDADDVWLPHHVNSILDIFKENSVIDIIYTKPRTFIDEKEQVIRRSFSRIPKKVETAVFSCSIGFPSATAFRKSKFLFYDSNYKSREDIELLLRSYLRGFHIHLSDTQSVMIRQHRSPHRMSLSSTFFQYTIKLKEDYLDKIPSPYNSLFLLSIAEVAFKFNQSMLGLSLTAQAVGQSPTCVFKKTFWVDVVKRAMNPLRWIPSF